MHLYGFGSVKEVDISTAIFSLLETAKVKYFDLYDYVEYLLETIPNINYMQSPEKSDDFLPWNE